MIKLDTISLIVHEIHDSIESENFERAADQADVLRKKMKVKTPSDALVMTTEKILIDLRRMAQLRSRSKLRYVDRIKTAQQSYDWVKEMGVNYKKSLVKELDKCGGSVEEWLKPWEKVI